MRGATVRDFWTTACEIAGLALMCAAAAFTWPPLGLFVGGAFLVLIAWRLQKRGDQ